MRGAGGRLIAEAPPSSYPWLGDWLTIEAPPPDPPCLSPYRWVLQPLLSSHSNPAHLSAGQ